MKNHKLLIKLLGFIITIAGTTHLFLNLYVIVLPLILKNAGDVQNFMHKLAQMFGPIAVQEDRNILILCMKITASALFLTSGIGVMNLREWSRILLFLLLGLRIIYGTLVCIIHGFFHPHLAIIVAAGLLLFYLFTRPKIAEQFNPLHGNPRSSQAEG